MGEVTKIQWADATVNPWWGCTVVSEACRDCYAEALAHRWGKDLWGPGKPREDHRAGAAKLARKLNRQAEREGRRLRVFCLSMGDWLDPEAPAEWLADLLALVDECRHLEWLLLTKRPELWSDRLHAVLAQVHHHEDAWLSHWLDGEAPRNVRVGTTVENQWRADERIPALLAIPNRRPWLSCEPLLGPIDLGPWLGELDQIIVGGESGPGCRPMALEWARGLRDQARHAGVFFFLKQLGGHPDKRGELEQFPEDLRIREVPTLAPPGDR